MSTAELIQELTLASPWSREQATAAVEACLARGLDESQARQVCEFSLQSGIHLGWVLHCVGRLEGVEW